MGWIRTIVSEVYGLFVDDGSFAVAIIVWLAIVGLALSRLGMAAGWTGVILFAGLALILAESATRAARKR